ncbi:MAG: DUF4129 domain-containing protein [Sulfolobales archaeon]|nr:DUF4129 domain-containing protein [Sulfolobales archaeon]MDW8010407.1 DUF4129 domain-containing protein [Sulfolobales archaeon]
MWVARAVLLLVLLLLAAPQVVLSRHLSSSPEEYLKEAIALEILSSWVGRCFNVSFEFSKSAEYADGELRSLLEARIGGVLSGSRLGVLAMGGSHFKALQLLLGGAGELRPASLREVLSASVLSLVLSGVPYGLVEEVLSRPSISSLLKLLAYVSRFLTASKCFRDLVAEVVYFGLSLESGNVERARSVAEEVLNSNSIFFGTVLVLVLENPPTKLRTSSRYVEISEEAVEKLVLALSRYDINLGEILAKHSISEILELLEVVGSIENLDLVLRRIDSINVSTLTEVRRLLAGLDEEDVLRYSLGGESSPQRTPGGGSSGGSSSVEDVGERVAQHDIDRLVDKVPQRVLKSAIEAIDRATLSLSKSRGRPLAREGTTPSSGGSGDSLGLGAVAALLLAAASIGFLYPYVLRGSSRRFPRFGIVLSRDAGALSTAGQHPVVEFFWKAVAHLAAVVKIEILPSETHREVVERLESRIDGVTSAALRRLSKLYELARFSRSGVPSSVGEDLEFLRKILWGVGSSLE